MTVDESTYMPINGFTTVDLGCERGNNAYYTVMKTESFENANHYIKLFEQLWNDKKKLQEVTDIVIENISAAYRENAPEYIYFVALYNIFKEFLDDISEDELPNEATGFKNSKIFGNALQFPARCRPCHYQQAGEVQWLYSGGQRRPGQNVYGPCGDQIL